MAKEKKLTKKEQEAADRASAAQSGRKGDAGKSALEQLLGAAPPALGTEQQPIGVPPGYTAQRRSPDTPYVYRSRNPEDRSPHYGVSPGAVTPVAPRYFEGDDYKPAGQSPEKIAAMQRELVAGGVLKKTGFQLGVWDEPTRAAYARVLATANASGVTADEALAQYKAAPKVSESDERGPILLTNPKDLETLADDLAVKRLGRRLRADEKQQLVSGYRNVELTEEQRFRAMSDAGSSAPMSKVQAPSDFIESELVTHNPVDVEKEEVADRAGVFFDLLREHGVGNG